MFDIIMTAGIGVAGFVFGLKVGADTYARRLRDAARYAPRDQVALATLERAMREDRRNDLHRSLKDQRR